MANLRTNNLSGEGGKRAYRGSVFFSGADDYIDLSSDSALAASIPAGDEAYTIEMWVLFGRGGSAVDSGGSDSLIAYGLASTRSYNGIDWTGTAIRNVWYGDDLSYTVDLVDGAWHHIAATYDQTTRRLFVDGVLGASDTPSDHSVGTTNNGKIGASTGGVVNRDFKGYISNLRITKRAIYTAAFTPPAQELTADDDVMLLCCQDSDDPTQEATGKTITGFGSLQESNDTELVTNSGFTVDISGWTASGVQFTHSSGALMHFGNGNTQRNIYQDVTTVVGKKYIARVLASSAEASTAYWQVGPTDDMTTVNYVADNNNSGQLPYHYFFTATSTTTRIRFYSHDSSNSSNVRSYWYLASIKLAEQPKAPKIIPPYGTDAGNTFDGAINMNSPSWMYLPTGRTEERGRGRGVLSGGRNNHAMQFVNIQSQGNSIIFGDSITGGGIEGFAVGSSTRGLFSGRIGPIGNVIEFITFATTSNGTDFGDMTTGRRSGAGAGNETRGLFAGGLNDSGTSLNTIEFSTIPSLGNSTDFGDLTQARDQQAGCSDTTRAIFAGGVEQGSSQHNIIDFVTIATTGNAQDFGDTTALNHGSSGSSDSTRGVIALGYTAPNSMINTIDFITIQSAGDATDFGDLTQARYLSANMSNSTRAVIAGGGTPSALNTIDFVTIKTTGNANDFGDLIGGANHVVVGTSDSHGGLS